MRKKLLIIIGFAHLLTTPGKRSPDGKFREAIYSREVGREIKAKLEAAGYTVVFDYDGDKLPKTMQTPMAKLEQQRELALRAANVNEFCNQYGKENCIYVSIHVNASPPNDGKWHDARGWCVYTSPGRTKADDLATCLWYRADKNLPHVHKNAIRADWSDKDPDFEAALYVLTKTACPAVLTENLFQDNREDVAYLTSDEGRHAIERLHVEGIIDYIQKFMS
ncbi:MAG: N-acetylmuramoyl-L-alanine amidase [Prevotella sp.]|nr:N-acetylmuramoyl-L-alanine amidase [Prevotella sp.]MBR3479297.1 N-acetylmuramoyl-L-alanine amidase [Prevotella sp.]